MAAGSGKRFSRPAGMHRSGGPWSHGNARHQLGRAAQSLQHDAIALGQFQEAVDAVLRLVGVEREGEADRGKTDRRGAGDPSVPRKTRSPPAPTAPPFRRDSNAVATARSVAPPQADRASNSKSSPHGR